MAGKEEQHEGVSSLSDMMATPITPAAKPRVSLHIVLGLVTRHRKALLFAFYRDTLYVFLLSVKEDFLHAHIKQMLDIK